jgi:hypothetical protein
MTESAVRSRATAKGLAIQKSRSRCQEWLGYGTYRIVDAQTNCVVHGDPALDYFGLSLDECAEYIEQA